MRHNSLEMQYDREIKSNSIGNLFKFQKTIPFDIQVIIFDYLDVYDIIQIISKKKKKILPLLSLIKILHKKLKPYINITKELQYDLHSNILVYLNRLKYFDSIKNEVNSENEIIHINKFTNDKNLLYASLYLFKSTKIIKALKGSNEIVWNSNSFYYLSEYKIYDSLFIKHYYYSNEKKSNMQYLEDEFNKTLNLFINLGYELYNPYILDDTMCHTKCMENYNYISQYPIVIAAKYSNINAFEMLLEYHNQELINKNKNYTQKHHDFILLNIIRLCSGGMITGLKSILTILIKYNEHIVQLINNIGDLSLIKSYNLVEFNNLEALNIMLEHGLDVNIKVAESSIINMQNAQSGDDYVYTNGNHYKGINNSVNLIENHRTLIHAAISDNRYYMVHLLLKYGVDINAKCEMSINENYKSCIAAKCIIPNSIVDGFTPLHIAAYNNYVSILRLILNHDYTNSEQKLDVNSLDINGRSPIFYARNSEAVLMLINYGADTKIKDISGNSIADYLSSEMYLELKDYI